MKKKDDEQYCLKYSSLLLLCLKIHLGRIFVERSDLVPSNNKHLGRLELVIGKMLAHVCLSFGQDLAVAGIARRVRLVSDDAPEPDSTIAAVANVHVAVESCNQRVLLQRTFIVAEFIRIQPILTRGNSTLK